MSELEAGVRRVAVVVPDAVGRLSGKTISAREWPQVVEVGLAMPNFHLVTDYSNAPAPGVTVPGAPEGFGNGVLRPDLDTLRVLPWDPTSAIVLADAYDTSGNPESCAPRNVLLQQVRRLQDAGMHARVATELEFYLLDCSVDEMLSSSLPRAPLGRSADHDLLGLSVYEPFLHEVMDVMEEMGLPAEACHGEGGVGQVEIAFPHGDPMSVSDRHVIFKYVVKRLARERGLAATFMAQPFQHEAGSSCHVHLSLWNEGGPLLLDDTGELTVTGASALDAVLRLAGSSTLVHAPNTNSYRRLQPGSWSPSVVDWGYDDRTRLLRVLGAGGSGRFEFRLPGADCNPYLSVAALIASVRAAFDALPMERGDLQSVPQSVDGASPGRLPDVLPRDLTEGVQRFRQCKELAALLGADVSAHLVNRAVAELDAARSVVTDWERQRLAEIV